MLYLISYDIPDNRRRTKVAKTLLDFGDRVQFSVFECILTPALLATMSGRIKKIIHAPEDSIRIYGLCAGCERAITIIGQGQVSKNADVYIL